MSKNIIEGKAFVIEPGKKYIIVLDKYHISAEEAQELNRYINSMGAESVSVTVGDPNSVKIIEL